MALLDITFTLVPKYFDFFRARSHHGSSSNSDDYVDPLEAELDLIPPTTAPPPHCKFGRLMSDPFKPSSGCTQKTKIVVFEDDDIFEDSDSMVHLAYRPGPIGRRKCSRHISVCVGEVQNGISLPSAARSLSGNDHLKQLFVDTRLANQTAINEIPNEATTSVNFKHLIGGSAVS
ncbi:unnamed protein product [Enterobius vermicularis]|uniref:Uncharacterized protein n=1 Tax=Enterobius vermicularis TaxID=51028 RepID=A0A0N4UW44_ENTVE|nr:unnamed protein product [Enterobius vermicularis]